MLALRKALDAGLALHLLPSGGGENDELRLAGLAQLLGRLDAAASEVDFLDQIVDHIPLMVFVKEAETLRFVRFSKAGLDLLGFEASELIGRNDYDFFPKIRPTSSRRRTGKCWLAGRSSRFPKSRF